MPIYQLSDIAADANARRRPDGTLVIAIDGPSGSGKSRLARRIARAVGDDFTVLHADDLVAGWDSLLEVPHRLAGVLAELRAGRTASYDTWDWAADRVGPPAQLEPTPTIVVEGCGSGGLACAQYVDFLVWVDAPPGVRRERAIARDGDTYAAHWERWAAQERELYARDRVRERADVVIDGRRPVR
ncbi:hypothetical protein EK0264_00795 [Epidermidibacterium keratini]|uniref:AAA family ATPase n=1 Tax=Epidermidibacterium keratini TaxID=1891644 RepID=A0A7L4YKA7_9ACTN|nr:AAA family ATPase [Epidermidibacterium keratini]QHB98976.1 hypothetical protein EK0264_00795 [Epidermidibacterium keratini]